MAPRKLAEWLHSSRQRTTTDRSLLDCGGHYGIKLALWALLQVVALNCAADPPDTLFTYRTAAGDTLIGIGRGLLKDPGNWITLQRLNAIADPYRMPSGAPLRIPVRLLRGDPVPARVLTVEGDVRSGEQRLTAGGNVDSDAWVTTGDDGYTTLKLVDGSTLTLQPRTRLRLDTQRVRGTQASRASFSLERGRVEATTMPQHGADQHRLKTPAVVLSVRGTRYRAAVTGDKGRSLAEVTVGTVAVGNTRSAKIALRQGFGISAARGQPLPPPTALLPAPDLSGIAELQQRVMLNLRFPPLKGAKAYRVQIAADQDFREIVAEQVVGAAEAKLTAPPDGDYWLRVRGIDMHALEGLDGIKQFRLRARPEPPFPSQPKNGGKASSAALQFRWAAVTGAARYVFQIARDDAFGELHSASAETADTAYSPTEALAPGEYYWRVASVQADGKRGPFGDPQRFQLRPAPAKPEPPTIDKEQVDFAWAGEPGQSFEFQLARDAEFKDIIDSRRLEAPETTLQRPSPGTYFMRVRATDPDGFVGPFTATQRFEVRAATPWWLLLFLIIPLSL